MRAAVYTVEAEGAIHVAGFLRLKELQLTASLMAVASQAIMRCAGVTNFETAHSDFDWRYERLNELVLAYGTHVLAETGSFKQTVDEQSGCEIANDQPRDPARTIPQARRFIGP